MEVIKRSGERVKYDGSKIVMAVKMAMADIGVEVPDDILDDIENDIMDEIQNTDIILTVEMVSDRVEQLLMQYGQFEVAKSYIIYRKEKDKERLSKTSKESFKYLSNDFLSKYKHMPNPFTNQLGEFVYYRTYSRYLSDKNRREFWWETVARSVNYNIGLVKHKSFDEAKLEAESLFDNIYNLKQFLSGRTFFTGGTKASLEYGMSNYNCSFTIIDEFESYKDMFYLLLVGAGVGFRVLKSDVAKLPQVRTDLTTFHLAYEELPKHKRQEFTSIIFTKDIAEIIIGDSKESWCDALGKYFDILSKSEFRKVSTIMFKYNNIRPKGERLKTFGGYSSGYQSMESMLKKIDKTIKKRSVDGEKVNLTTLDCMDIANIIGENVVSGGVRRTSEVCLFDSDDDAILSSKSSLWKQDDTGNWEIDSDIAHRRMSNNSIQYWSKPEREAWHKHIQEMRYSGEPAFQNMVAAVKRRSDAQGGNPCMEIILKKNGVCNLTEVNVMGFVVNNKLNLTELYKAQRLSARAGYRMASIQFELHNWDLVNKEDMLLGCSLTGWQDMVNATGMDKKEQASILKELRKIAREAADNIATELGTNKSKLVTTVKPSGSVSQLPTVSSGVHYSHSPYFIRRVRINAFDPLAQVAKDLGWKWTPEVNQTVENMDTMVIEFYVKSPEGRTKYDVSAIEQLEMYKMFMECYTDHNVSITVHVRPDEWDAVEEWTFNNWDDLVAVSFLALDDSFYQLLPYESITKEQYDELIKTVAKFNPTLISKYETQDEFDLGDSECAGGACPVR